MKTYKATLENGCCWRVNGKLKMFSSPVWIKTYPDGEYYILVEKGTIIQIVPV